MTRRRNLILLAAIIALGIGSRSIHTGWVVFDKYLGDALYAAMVYVLLSLATACPARTKAIVAMLLMTAIECFQLTSIPAQLYRSGNGVLKLVAILLGLQFEWADLLAYAIGIGVIAIADAALAHKC